MVFDKCNELSGQFVFQHKSAGYSEEKPANFWVVIGTGGRDGLERL